MKAVNPGIVYCSTSGYGQDGPRSQWAGHDLNYLAVGGYLDCSGRGADGGPALPGRHHRRLGGRRHAGGHGRSWPPSSQRQTTGEGQHLDVAAADGVLALMSLYVEQHLATGDAPGPRHDLLTGRYACYDLYEASRRRLAVRRRHRAALLAPTSAACSATTSSSTPRPTTPRQDEIRAAFRAALQGRGPGTSGPPSSAPPTPASPPVLTIAEAAADEQYAARGAIVDATHPTEGAFRQVGPVLAGQPGQGDAVEVPDWAQTSTDEILTSAGYSADELEPSSSRRRDRMTDRPPFWRPIRGQGARSGARTEVGR